MNRLMVPHFFRIIKRFYFEKKVIEWIKKKLRKISNPMEATPAETADSSNSASSDCSVTSEGESKDAITNGIEVNQSDFEVIFLRHSFSLV